MRPILEKETRKMENKITQVLDQQINEVEIAIRENKTKVGDLFLNIHSRKIMTELTPENVMSAFKEMDKMPPLIAKHETLSTKLETLQKTKQEIEKAESELLVK